MKRQMMFVSVLIVLMIVTGCRDRADTSLTIAAAQGDAAEVQKLLTQGAEVNVSDSSGLTALMWAARSGHTETMKALLDAGADINMRDCAGNGWTPLIHALHKSQNRAAYLLLDRGADVNARAGECREKVAEGGVTPLMIAAVNDDAALIEALLAKGADPYAESNGYTALTHAVGASMGGWWDIDSTTVGCPTATVKAILASAPDLKMQGDVWGKSALFFARHKGCSEILSLLEEKKSVLAWDQKGLRFGTHYVTISPYENNSVESADNTHRITMAGITLLINNEELIVNGKSYGVLREGDAVDVNYGKVRINNREAPESGVIASK